MKRRGLSKIERKIRDHRLREYVSPRVEAERARAESERQRDEQREAEYQAWRAGIQQQETIRERAEAAAAALHRQWLDEGMREYQARGVIEAAKAALKARGH